MNINSEVLQVRLEDIVPNRFQPREHFENDGIEELAQSIKEHGIIQPLVLRRLGDKYEIIAGERRYKAATLAGLSTVPAILSDIDDNKSAEIALVENIQRRNLTSIEEARSYKAILDKGYLTQEGLAQKMGVSQSQIANKLRLLNLCEEVQDALMTGKISERHARALLAVSDFNEQKMWLNRILKERLTVRQLDIELKKNGNDTDEGIENSIPKVSINPDLDEIKNKAQDIISVPEIKDLSSIFNLDNDLLNIDNLNKSQVVEEPKEEKETPVNNNRFFNFLEDEGPNMNMEEPSVNQFMNIQPEVQNTQSNPFIEDLNVINPGENINQVTETIPEAPMTNFINPFMETNNEPVSVEYSVQTMNSFTEPVQPSAPASFINPFMDEPVPNSVNTPESTPSTINSFNEVSVETPVAESVQVNNIPNMNSVINDLTLNINNDMVDPMSRVEQLNPNYVPPVIQEEKFSLNDAISDIRNIAKELERKGFYVNIEEIALADGYKFTIDIKN